MPKIIGIDLGTTNSAMAVMEGSEPEILVNAEGDRTTPSVVGFGKDGERTVGKAAKNKAVTNPENTIASVKRFIGRSYGETGEEQKTVAYNVKNGNGGRAVVAIDERDYMPEEISATALQKIKSDAEKRVGRAHHAGSHHCPWDTSTMHSVRQRRTQVRLLVSRCSVSSTSPRQQHLRMVSTRPTKMRRFSCSTSAAVRSTCQCSSWAMAYSKFARPQAITILVAIDWDQRIIDWLADKFQADNGIDLRKDKMAMQRLKEAAEKAKMELSSTTQTTINLPFFISAGEAGPLHLDYTLTRAEFERITKDLLDRCKLPVEQALKDAGLKTGDVDEVILVGGSTRMPAVQELVEKITGKKPNMSVNPD